MTDEYVMVQTLQLRWLEITVRQYGHDGSPFFNETTHRVLQQKWNSQYSDAFEWRDVPTAHPNPRQKNSADPKAGEDTKAGYRSSQSGQ